MLDNGLPFSLAAVVGDGELAQFQVCDLNLARMTREEYNLSLEGRLSEERVLNCVPEIDPDLERILRLAKQGVTIFRDSSFLAENPVPLYELLAPAVDQIIYHVSTCLPLYSYSIILHISHISHMISVHC
jgi:hypothetical protein